MRTIMMVIAAAALAGGIVYATIPGSDGVIHACYSKSGGTLRAIDASLADCKTNETPLAWNVQGPSGPMGPAGPIGPPGPAAVAYQTLVDSVAVGNAVTEVAALDLPGGSYVITGGLFAENPSPGENKPMFCSLAGTSRGLWLEAQTPGSLASSPFGQWSLTKAQSYSEPTHVALSCYQNILNPLTPVYVRDITLVATSVANVTNQ